MGLERYWHWTCDKCGDVAVRGDYGLPRGWLFLHVHKPGTRSGLKVCTHRCPKCQEDMTKDERDKGKPQLVAKK